MDCDKRSFLKSILRLLFLGSEEDQKKLRDIRMNMRTMYGAKTMREVVYK